MVAPFATERAHPQYAAAVTWQKRHLESLIRSARSGKPMTKRRGESENWYSLPLEERAAMMSDHGLVGRAYAGRISQIISGSIGFDDWEWGVTLFAQDALDFKNVITDMRYDEASARYAEFGPFYVGKRMRADEWLELGRT